MIRADIPSTLDPSTNPSEDDESLWVRVHIGKSKNLYLCSFYKPPNAAVSRLDYLSQSLGKLYHTNKKSHPSIVIAGDFNLGDIDWTLDPPVPTVPTTSTDMEHLLDLIDANALSQHVTMPTRPASQKILDLVLSSSPNLVTNVDIAPGISDHDIVTFVIDMKPRRTATPPHKVYLFKNMDIDGLRSDITEIQKKLIPAFDSLDVNDNWNFFKSHLIASIEKRIPSKMTKSKFHLPWISLNLKRQMRKRDKLLSKAKKSKSPKAWCVYKQQRNKVTKALKDAHNDYLNNVIGENLENDPKKFWRYVKRSRSDGSNIPTLISEDECLHVSDKNKANALNNYFKSVFTADDGNIPHHHSQSTSQIGEIVFDVNGVQKQLERLNVNKSGGPDGIPNRVLRDLSFEIAPILTLIFQQSYNTGQVPADWSKAMVSPIFKSGDKSKPCNYRPVSLTCVCCKVMEHVVLSHLNRFITDNNLLSNLQHGFRRGFSCETQLVLTVNDWMSVLNNRGQVDAILLDFSKAFDKVSHPKLLLKLKSYGIQGKTLDWIKAFLCNRFQFVSVSGSHSDIVSVTSGVPQGSVLGPTLFLLFINDIVYQTNSTLRLFADDCIVYRKIDSSVDHEKLDLDLNNLSSWSNRWQMTFNTSKCKILPITNKRSPSKYTYSLGDTGLEHVKSHRYLGITCNSQLRWSEHVNNISTKANRTLGIVRRILKPCSTDVKSRAYISLVRPQLEYASAVWNPYEDKRQVSAQVRTSTEKCSAFCHWKLFVGNQHHPAS